MSGPVYDDPISGYRKPTTPPPVCEVCGAHINPDYQRGPICGACLKEREDAKGKLSHELAGICWAIIAMLVKKNTDYGDSYATLRREYGPVAYLIRLADKANRLKALQSHEALVSESYEDTVRDIAGYALLELVYLRGEAA